MKTPEFAAGVARRAGRRLLARLAFATAIAGVLSCTKPRESEREIIRRIGAETQLPLPHYAKLREFTEPDILIDPVFGAKVELRVSDYDALRSALEAKTSDPQTP